MKAACPSDNWPTAITQYIDSASKPLTPSAWISVS